ncbi:MAG: serine protease [Leptospiraceae bacterium]|nr:serine protease [Leptospiraceae bacterium]
MKNKLALTMISNIAKQYSKSSFTDKPVGNTSINSVHRLGFAQTRSQILKTEFSFKSLFSYFFFDYFRNMSIIIFLVSSSYLFASENMEDDFKKSIVQVKITAQNPNFMFPWQPKKPYNIEAVGIVISKDKILTLASNLEYTSSIEVKKFSSYKNFPAKILKIDYESNLAILSLEDTSFYLDLIPIDFVNKPEITKPVSIVQLDNAGSIQFSKGRLTGMDMDYSSTGHTELPYISLNSNEKLDGNGELITDKGKALGILFKFNNSKNSGKAIPGFVLNYFVNNIMKSKQSPFPFKGFKYRALVDTAQKEFYGLDKNREGVIISEIIPYTGADKLLEPNDIIVEFGGRKIDSQGFFQHSDYGKQSLSFLAHTGEEFGFKRGKKLPVKIIRNKKELTLMLPLRSFPLRAIRIPYMHNSGRQPSYTIRGGFMFVELSEFLLREWGANWRSKVDKKLLYLCDYKKFQSNDESGRFLILIQTLPDEANNGYHNVGMTLVTSLDGKPVRSVKELDVKINSSPNDIVLIDLEDGVTLALDKTTLKQVDDRIARKFQIPILSNY